jgi:hypothetical protein
MFLSGRCKDRGEGGFTWSAVLYAVNTFPPSTRLCIFFGAENTPRACTVLILNLEERKTPAPGEKMNSFEGGRIRRPDQHMAIFRISFSVAKVENATSPVPCRHLLWPLYLRK